VQALSLMYHDVVEDGQWDSSGLTIAGAAEYKLELREFERHLAAIQAAGIAVTEFIVAKGTSVHHGARWCYASAVVAAISAIALLFGRDLRPRELAEGIVAAGHHDAGKRQPVARDGREAFDRRGKVRSLDVGRHDEERAVDRQRCVAGAMRDGEAAEAVRDQHHRTAGGADAGRERLHPLATDRVEPVALHDALEVGMRFLPEALPVLGAGVAPAGDDEDARPHGWAAAQGGGNRRSPFFHAICSATSRGSWPSQTWTASEAAPTDSQREVTQVSVPDIKSVTGTWKGIVYRSGGEPENITLTIREDGTYDIVSADKVGASRGSGKIVISDGRLVIEGERGRGVGTLARNGGGDLVMNVDATLNDNSTLSAKLWPSR